MKQIFLACLLVVAVACFPKTAPAQNVVSEALASFSPQTIRVEYSSPAKLRGLPNYENLRQRYVGPRLLKLEGSLSQLGVGEGDIDDLMLGWQAGQAEMDLYGFASGRFDAKAIAAAAAARGISPSSIAAQPAYCLEAGLTGTCVAVLGDSLGAFGSLTSLTAMLETRGGQGLSLNSVERFARLVGEAKKDAPIWGVTLGPAVGDWFRGWMPSQGNVKLDWAHVFQDVESLVYSVEAGDRVNVDMRLNCTTPEAAASLRRVLEGLKLAQQIAWQSQNPNRPNPFESMEVALSGNQVSLLITTGYAELEVARGVGEPRN
jgi:hypothetical protein